MISPLWYHDLDALTSVKGAAARPRVQKVQRVHKVQRMVDCPSGNYFIMQPLGTRLTGRSPEGESTSLFREIFARTLKNMIIFTQDSWQGFLLLSVRGGDSL